LLGHKIVLQMMALDAAAKDAMLPPHKI